MYTAPVSSAALAEQFSRKPAFHYHLATPPSRAIANQPASLNRSSEGGTARQKQQEEEQEIIQDPIIVGRINPIQPLQVNFDLGVDGDNVDQENLMNTAEERASLPTHFKGTNKEDAA